MKIMMVLERQDPFLDNYEQELFASHGMIDLIKVSSDDTVTVTLNKEFLYRMILSHIHAIRRISHAD